MNSQFTIFNATIEFNRFDKSVRGKIHISILPKIVFIKKSFFHV